MTTKNQRFYGENEHVSDPGDQSEVVVKDGSNFANGACKYLYVGTGGNVVGKGPNDSANRTWKNVPDGATIPFRFLSVDAASTAADILAIY